MIGLQIRSPGLLPFFRLDATSSWMGNLRLCHAVRATSNGPIGRSGSTGAIYPGRTIPKHGTLPQIPLPG